MSEQATDGGINPYYIGDCKYCAAKIALIDDAHAQEKIAQEVAWDLEQHIAELEAAQRWIPSAIEIFQHIKHGDQQHQEWLFSKLNEILPAPPKKPEE